jgi:long-chain acyl-CoA synthetase/crotonobetaine/carnitine-CoA ligase
MTALADVIAREKARARSLEATFETGTIGRFVSERCAALGDRMALNVFDRRETATFAEVDARSNQIAHALRSIGIVKGDRVGVMLPNCIAYPLTWLALAKIGAVHVPVNTRYTPREIAYLVDDSGAKALIIDAQFLDAFCQAEPRAPYLSDSRVLVAHGEAPGNFTSFEACVERQPTMACLDESLSPDDLMSIQYTSGTTGFPKGCMLSHEYWLILSWAAQQWDHTPVSRMMTAQPFFYMDPQWHLLKALRLGAALYMAPGLSASRFIGWVKQHRIEWCQFPLLMTKQPEAAGDRATALKQVAVFGWDSETCRAFKTRFGVMAREGFGMTEIGLGTWMTPVVEAMYDSASVGFNAPFRETTIRDVHGKPVAPGERGELWVRGRGLLKEYWQKPEANAEAFRDAEDGGPRWFRTGDIFVGDENGCLWIVGRIKDMIRRSSENIAACEVEAVIRELDSVEDCAAVPVPDAKRGEEVKIYVKLKSGLNQADLPPEAILVHARAKLAAFKVPRYYAYIGCFPRTVSNKVEKRNLVAGVSDLRLGAWDAEDGKWR